MASRIPARLTAAQGRRFGLTVGGAFLALALILLWRHHHGRAVVAGGIGIVLVVAGLAIPSRLGPVERAWHALGQGLSRLTTPVFLGVVYFLILTPVGWLRRGFGGRPASGASAGGTAWVPRSPVSRQQMERQF